MAIPNQELNQWQPGQSGNPSGREKGSKNRSTILKKWIEVNCSIIDPSTGQEITGTLEDKIALALIGKAVNGDVAAIKEVYDSIYGKLEQGNKDSDIVTVIMPRIIGEDFEDEL
jgi:hypothetical protein